MNEFQKIIEKQQKQIRKEFKILSELFPGAFTKDYKPIVASATFPVGEQNKNRS
jgi:hypothetical protein